MPISQFHLRTLYLGETKQAMTYMFRVINNTCQLCSFVKFYLYRCRFVTVTLDKQTSYQPFSSTLISVVSKVLIYETVLYLCLCKIWIKINVKIMLIESFYPQRRQNRWKNRWFSRVATSGVYMPWLGAKRRVIMKLIFCGKLNML